MADKPDNLDKVFEVSLILKGLDGLLEVIGGLLLFVVSSNTIQHFAEWLNNHELSENGHDFIGSHLIHWAHDLSVSSLLFASFYLLSHGIVKIVLVIAVLKQKLWAYPWMIAFLVIFILYQIYRLYVKFTIGITLLTAFDIFIVYLTVLEYKKHKLRAERT